MSPISLVTYITKILWCSESVFECDNFMYQSHVFYHDVMSTFVYLHILDCIYDMGVILEMNSCTLIFHEHNIFTSIQTSFLLYWILIASEMRD